MFLAYCFVSLFIFAFLPNLPGAEAQESSKIKSLELNFSKVKHGDLHIRVQCTVEVDRDRVPDFQVWLTFGKDNLTTTDNRKNSRNNITFYSTLTGWKSRVEESIGCNFKSFLVTDKKFIHFANYTPKEDDVHIPPASPVARGYRIECFVSIPLRPNVTIREKGKDREGVGLGSAQLIVPGDARKLEVECEAENAFGKIRKESLLEIASPSIKVDFHAPDSVDADASYVSCGLPSSTLSLLSHIFLRFSFDSPPHKKQFIIMSWRSKSGQPSVNVPEGFAVDSAHFNGRSLKARLRAQLPLPTHVTCRVLLENGSYGIESRNLTEQVLARVFNMSVRNSQGRHGFEFNTNRTIFVNCTLRLPNDIDDNVPARLEANFGGATKDLGAVSPVVFDRGGFRFRSFSWRLHTAPSLSSVTCRSGVSRLEQKLLVRYVSKPWFNFSSPHKLFPGDSVLCSADGYPRPLISFPSVPRWSDSTLRHISPRRGVSLLTVPLNTRPADYSLECVAATAGAKDHVTALISVRDRRELSNAGVQTLWRSYQWLWVAAVVLSLAFLAFAVAYWWRSQRALEKERRAQRKRRNNSSNQLVEFTPSPCRTPDSGFGTPETGRQRPTAEVDEGVVYAQLDFEERAAAKGLSVSNPSKKAKTSKKAKLSKKAKQKRKDSTDSIVYDIIVGEVANHQGCHGSRSH